MSFFLSRLATERIYRVARRINAIGPQPLEGAASAAARLIAIECTVPAMPRPRIAPVLPFTANSGVGCGVGFRGGGCGGSGDRPTRHRRSRWLFAIADRAAVDTTIATSNLDSRRTTGLQLRISHLGISCWGRGGEPSASTAVLLRANENAVYAATTVCAAAARAALATSPRVVAAVELTGGVGGSGSGYWCCATSAASTPACYATAAIRTAAARTAAVCAAAAVAVTRSATALDFDLGLGCRVGIGSSCRTGFWPCSHHDDSHPRRLRNRRSRPTCLHRLRRHGLHRCVTPIKGSAAERL